MKRVVDSSRRQVDDDKMVGSSMPLLDLLFRISGYQSSGAEPEWVEFCAPSERVIVQELVAIGQLRQDLRNHCTKCEAIGRRGHFLVAGVAMSVKESAGAFDAAIVRLSGQLHNRTPPSLHSIYASAMEYEACLTASVRFTKWLVDENKLEELFYGMLLDECFLRMERSHGSAKEAMNNIFQAMFETFKRTLIPWLAYGLLDSRTDNFFIKEPTDCKKYFREISPIIATSVKAPGHFTRGLIDKIAQYGYMRKFLGWRSKNVLKDSDLERLIGTHVQSLRNLNWREYKSYALEAIVDNFGEVYSKALYVEIFEKCKVRDILKYFQQMYLMSMVDLFDEFVGNVDTSLRQIPVKQTSNDKEPTVIGWECLQLEFAVQHPLDWFFYPAVMAKYQRVFKFLLRLKRLSVAFSLLWRNLRGARSSRRLEYGDYLELFHWHYTYSHVITAIQGFIQTTAQSLKLTIFTSETVDELYDGNRRVDVIHGAWKEFQNKINGVNDYVKLTEYHEAFLNNIIAYSLIGCDPLYKGIRRLTETCLEICFDIDAQLEKPKNVELNLDNIRGQIFDLNALLKIFVKLVKSSSSNDHGNPIAYLGLKLDVSGNLQELVE